MHAEIKLNALLVKGASLMRGFGVHFDVSLELAGELDVEQTIEWSMIRNALKLICYHCNIRTILWFNLGYLTICSGLYGMSSLHMIYRNPS